MTRYTDVQFVGYALPTTPKEAAVIGNPNAPVIGPFVEGRYCGLPGLRDDIDARIGLFMAAVAEAERSAHIAKSETTLKVFVVPEFSMRGPEGAYEDHPLNFYAPQINYFDYFRTVFSERVKDSSYKDWVFVIGTIVTSARPYTPKEQRRAMVREQMAMALADAWQFANDHDDPRLKKTTIDMLVSFTDFCHANPLCTIRNRCFVIKGGPADPGDLYPQGLSVEKKYVSDEDFTLNTYSDVFSEEAVSYPPVHDKKTEIKQVPFDDLSIFTLAGINFGVEICLDHSDSRLRKHFTRDKSKPVQIQIVPSCSDQLVDKSVVSVENGWVFNCDGAYGDIKLPANPDLTTSVWTVAASNRAHSQLTRVETPPVGNGEDPNTSAKLVKPDVQAHVVSMPSVELQILYAYGPGEVHIYDKVAIPPAR